MQARKNSFLFEQPPQCNAVTRPISRGRCVVFMGDFSKRTLERRRSKIPDILEARRNGKTAFMVMDYLVIFDKPRVTDKCLDDADDEFTLSGKLHTKTFSILIHFYVIVGLISKIWLMLCQISELVIK